MKGLVLFDVDGTLIEGSKIHRESFQYAIKEVFDADVTFEDIFLKGMIDNQIIDALLFTKDIKYNDDEYHRMIDLMIKYYHDKSGDDPIILLPGVNDLLIKLKEQGFAIGLLTGNIEEIAYGKLDKFGLSDFFPIGGFGTEADSRKNLFPIVYKKAKEFYGEDFDKKKIFHVGDTVNDELTAFHNHIHSIAVGTGHSDYNELENNKPDLLFENFSDTDEVMRKINEIIEGSNE